MPTEASPYCRICGLAQPEPPWGVDGRTPDFTFCPCCGVEFGYQDCTLVGIRRFRAAWIENGAKWDSPKEKPENWSLEAQLENIPDEFR